jgi:hypothetical protein
MGFPYTSEYAVLQEYGGAALVHDHLAVDAVHLGDVLAGDDLLRGADILDDPGLGHQDHAVGKHGGDVEVVADHYHHHPLGDGYLVHQGGDEHLVPYVQVGGGLVQDQDLRLLDQAAGDGDGLVLSG